MNREQEIEKLSTEWEIKDQIKQLQNIIAIIEVKMAEGDTTFQGKGIRPSLVIILLGNKQVKYIPFHFRINKERKR